MKNYSKLIIISACLGVILAIAGIITLFFELLLGLVFIMLGVASLSVTWLFKRKEQHVEKEHTNKIIKDATERSEREFNGIDNRNTVINSGTISKFKGEPLFKFFSDYTAIDTETTGFSPTTDYIIELAAVRVRNGVVTEKFSTLVHSTYLPKKITNLTGITDAMLQNAPEIEETIRKFFDFVGNDIVVGHNVNFDIGFITENCLRYLSKPFNNDFVDTYKLSQLIIPRGSTPNYKLPTLVDSLNLPPSNSHRAMADALSTIQLYNYLKSAVANQAV